MGGRYGQIMLGLFLVFIGLGALSSGNTFGVLMGLFGFYLIARQFEEGRGQNNRNGSSRRSGEEIRALSYDDVPLTSNRTSHANADQVYAHALQAVKRVGLAPDQLPILPVDIGVMAYRDGKPRIFRTSAVPDDVDYIQPFVQLRLPTRARGKIRLELIDADGELVFMREEEHDLKRGRNLITSSGRLPVHDALALEEGWTLRVYADGNQLAEHSLKWRESNSEWVRDALADDGEISQELRVAMNDAAEDEMSLDDLLSFQEDAKVISSGR